MIKRLDWDSNFFEFEVGELLLNDFQNSDACNNYNLLYVISKNDFDLQIDNFKKCFEEEKTIFIKDLKFLETDNQSIQSIDQAAFNKNELYELAFESGKKSRFKLDSNFESEKFEQFYKLWIDNSISKTIADDVFLCKFENKTIAFVTFKVVNNIATIGLIAVDANFQGQGIGKDLLTFVENKLFLEGVHQLIIPTQQANVGACKFYSKMNYKIHDTLFLKHYWKI